MPVDGKYSDSGTPDNTQNCDTWKSIGQLARALAEKAAKNG